MNIFFITRPFSSGHSHYRNIFSAYYILLPAVFFFFVYFFFFALPIADCSPSLASPSSSPLLSAASSSSAPPPPIFPAVVKEEDSGCRSAKSLGNLQYSYRQTGVTVSKQCRGGRAREVTRQFQAVPVAS